MFGLIKTLPLNKKLGVIVFVLLSLILLSLATPAVALSAGIIFAAFFGNNIIQKSQKITKYLLQFCVVLLGFGMNLQLIIGVGLHGFVFTLMSIVGTLIFGMWLGSRLNVEKRIGLLISAGTAICGGSAIAAVSSVIGATEAEIAVSIGTIFLLNAAALYLFPLVGHLLHLSQLDFGLWAGVAIHDISSVVAATIGYGPNALQSALAIKLSRTLWIIPLTLFIAYSYSHKLKDTKETQELSKKAKVQFPWFIGLFLLASLSRSYLPWLSAYTDITSHIARLGMVLVLLLIGSSLSIERVRNVGWRAMLSGFLLWLFISLGSLAAIIVFHLRA
jgi:uncharacterized integral membrane protein (TIGR00698 family)